MLLDPILIEGIENSPLAEPEPEIESQVAAHVRKAAPHGRGVLPAHLEREVVEIDIPEEQKILPDGCVRPCIGFEESEKLACTPQRFYVKLTRRLKYGSPVGAEEFGVVEAPVPESLVPRCLADESLLAHVAVSKFGDHLPVYRLEGIFKRVLGACPPLLLQRLQRRRPQARCGVHRPHQNSLRDRRVDQG